MGTTVEPIHPTTNVDDYILNGTLSYQGPITQPIATNPAFDQEIQIDHGTGSPSVVQYYMPDGYALPVALNQPYTVTFRRRNGFESHAVGVVIVRPTSGLPPAALRVRRGRVRPGVRGAGPDDGAIEGVPT